AHDHSPAPSNPHCTYTNNARFHHAPETLVTGVGTHRPRAHEANADLRDQSRELGHSWLALRRALSRHVAAARRPGAAAGTAMESANRMNDVVLGVRDVCLRRGARQILAGVTFEAGRGELVAIMGPSGSGKTTILRA